MLEPKSLTRRELYDLVWSKPMMLLADEFGVTGTGLAKICERYHVPTPPRGYWAKLQHSKRVRQQPFVEVDNPSLDLIVIRAGAWHLPDAALEVIRQAKQRQVLSERPMPQPPSAEPTIRPISVIHPLLRRTAQALREGKPDSDGGVHATGGGMLGITVGATSIERAISIVDGLLRSLSDRGLVLEAVGKGLLITNGSVSATLTLTERTQFENHVPTPQELAAEERRIKRLEGDWASSSWDTPTPGGDLFRQAFAEFDTVWTGELVLQADGYADGVRRTWADGRKQRLDRMIDNVATGIEALLAVRKVKHAEGEERQRQYAEWSRRHELVRHREEREKKREAFLAEMMQLQREADDLEAWLAGRPIGNSPAADDSNARMVTWVSARLADLRQRAAPASIREALDVAKLFPDVDDLDNPLEAPPDGHPWC